jgi:hypothetical protein
MRFCIRLSIGVLTACLAACTGGSKLTSAQADKALKAFCGNNGNIKVIGIQELPENNAAVVNVQINGCVKTINNQKQALNEPGIAGFTHYNDGRWVMTEFVIRANQGLLRVNFNNVNYPAD